MNQSSLQLRPAAPIFEEGLAFARYLDIAAEGFFRLMLGRNAAEIIARAYSRPDHDLSYQYVTFAERDKIIVGMVSGYSAAQHRLSSDAPLKQAAGGQYLRMAVVTTVFARLLQVLDTIKDKDFYIQAIAVDNTLRGEGIGSILFDFIENQAVISGSDHLSLDVSAGNVSAQKFYKKHGMHVESSWPKHWVIPGFRLYRFTKHL
ncbi:MAG: GNAT family N-acetyltransferase [Candidatus Thiodiazotropha sp. (ex Myrtea sp. 'scaly one' KF741663)]|nr:GNAT family N-acetyltransferase [Candidatus Thiodiazotropha sp. (ex Myrtea sp. 'scaly one' KF741663)]